MKSLVFSLVVVTSLGISSCDSSKPTTTTSPTTPSATDASSSSSVPKDNWNYSDDTDEMTGKKMAWACTNAPEGARLCLRKKNGRLESYIIFDSVSDGQFLCLEDNCSSKARFDDDPAITFGGVEAAGGNTTMLFIEPTSKLIAHLHKAKTLKLQPPIYEHSGEVLHFAVSGLKW